MQHRAVNTIFAAFILMLPPLHSTAAEYAIPVDLELVLAIDTSSSVDDAEYKLQMDGVIDAFRDPDVIATIQSTGPSGIAVTVVHWSSAFRQQQIVPWTQIYDTQSAFRFAFSVSQNLKRRLRTSTGLGKALGFSADLIDANSFAGRRKSIDVSGDGRSNTGPPLAPLRQQVLARGITINALAITNEDPSLLDYYQDAVIGGDGAFAMAIDDYRNVAEALKLKLLREIATKSADVR